MWVQEDRQTGMDHRTACQLLSPHQITLKRDRVQQRDPRERAQQQNPGATWMELQMCWASDVTQELRMMAQIEEFSGFPHAASRALSLLLENTETVALKAPTRRNVSMWHQLKWCLRSWHRLLRSSWQRNTDVSSSLRKLIGIGEVKLLSAAAGRVPWAFRWLFIEIHEQIF